MRGIFYSSKGNMLILLLPVVVLLFNTITIEFNTTTVTTFTIMPKGFEGEIIKEF